MKRDSITSAQDITRASKDGLQALTRYFWKQSAFLSHKAGIFMPTRETMS